MNKWSLVNGPPSPGPVSEAKKMVTKIVMRIVMRCHFDFETCPNFSLQEFFKSTFWGLFRYNFHHNSRYNSRHNFRHKNFTSETGPWFATSHWNKSCYDSTLKIFATGALRARKRRGVKGGANIIQSKLNWQPLYFRAISLSYPLDDLLTRRSSARSLQQRHTTKQNITFTNVKNFITHSHNVCLSLNWVRGHS